MIPTRFRLIIVFWFVISLQAFATVRYVNVNNPSPASPYNSWAKAATNIQTAIDAANPGDQILVTNGIYQVGNRVVSGMTNRVAVTKEVSVASVNGSAVTSVDGGSAMRCFNMVDGSSLSGFTLTNGMTPENGGGIRCDTTNVVITNCILTSNLATNQGGGAFQGTLINCSLIGNSAGGGVTFGNPAGGGAGGSVLIQCVVSANFTFNRGMGGGLNNCLATLCRITNNIANLNNAGGAYVGTLNDCLLAYNDAGYAGGGAFGSVLNNCTVVANTAENGPGGGVDSCTVNNCIVYYNSFINSIFYGWTPDQTNCAFSTLNYSCTTPQPTNGTGNISVPPLVVDPVNGDWHLQSNSPCIDGGNNAYVATTNDLDGNPRIIGLVVDIGAYEYQAPTIAITLQPLGQARRIQQSVQFSVAAISPLALSYQWSLNQTNIIGATNASLVLTNLQMSQAGNYAVQISNASNSVVSSNALLTINGPQPGVPYILVFTPASGGIGTVVTITGFNFSPTATNDLVWFGAVAATVQSANPSNLVVTVPPGAIYAPITVTVNGLVAYANAPFVPTFVSDGSAIGTNTFGPPLNLGSGSGPIGIAIADMDGDGKPDLVIANLNDHTISLFRNTSSAGTVSFAPRVDLAPIQTPCCEGNPNFISVADVDGDGKPDILVCDWAHNQILVYQNIATPGALTTNSFAAPVGFGAAGEPLNVRVADVDGDGKPDIIIANDAVGMVSILHNIGTAGTLTANSFAPHVDFSTGRGTWDIAIADLDGDGRPDIAAAIAGASYMSVFRNTSVPRTIDSNSFAPCVNLPAPTNCWAVMAADVDGDGKVDLIAGSDSGAGIAVYRNLISSPGPISTNSFASPVNFASGGVVSLVGGDLNGDGRTELNLGGAVSVFPNLSTPGSFDTNSLGARVDLPAGSLGAAVGDLDGDGRPDIAASGTTVFQNLLPFGGPPIIIVQPADLTVPVNTTATFTAFIAGKAPLSYQWFFNGTNLSDGGRFTGSATASLSISNIQTADVDDCYLIATNSFGAVTSRVVVLTPVVLPPNFTLQPQSQTNILGSNITFIASVSGSQPMAFEWLFNNAPMTDGGRVSGSATTNLTITGLLTNDVGAYQLVASNAANTVTSAVASLTVLVPPLFTQQPSNQSVILGSNATFSVTVDGTAPFSYQWFFNSTPLTDNGHVSGSTTTNLTRTDVQEPDVGNYTVAITNVAGSATSVVATLAISTPLISTQPQSQSVLAGVTVTLGVIASGQQPLAYQWQFDGTNIQNAVTNTLVLTNVLVNQSGIYSVTITNAYGTAISSNATLTVTALTISTQPTNRVAWLNGSTSFRVNVSGTAPFTFDWRCNGADVPGPQTNLLTLTNLQAAQFGTYYVIVSNAYGSVISSNATLFLSQVAAWGSYYGETNLPPGLTNLIAISGGSVSTMDCLALRGDGTTVSWPSSPPGLVIAEVTNLIAIACGGAEGSNLGLRPDGTVISWGFDTPLTIQGLTNIAAIAPHNYNYLALKTNGTLVNLGLAGPVPSIVTNLANVVAIAEGYQHTLALKADGTVAAWGSNTYGQTNVPAGLSNVLAIAAGGYHSLALKSDSTVIAWGRGIEHQTNVPAGLSNVVAVAAGGYHSLALKSDGTVVAWGMNIYGQTNVPAGLTNVIAIAAGTYHSLALIGNGPPVTQVLLSDPNLGNNNFGLSLPSQSGKVYVLQYQNSLSDGNWISLPLVPGNGGTLLLTDLTATNSQRIYRVQQW